MERGSVACMREYVFAYECGGGRDEGDGSGRRWVVV